MCLKKLIYMDYVFYSEAGCTPFAASMIADYFPKQTRALALGVYNWGIYIGYSMSYAFGNFITKANINHQVISTL